MENTEKQKYKVKLDMKWFLAGLVATAVCIWMVLFMSQFFWIALPFVFTFLAKSIDAL